MLMKNIVSHFKVPGTYIYHERFGCGHINDTYAVYFKYENTHPTRYILQRINDEVFPHPEQVMSN
ncbi:MAG: mucin desulfatase, partial [Clostridia bacterium]